MTFRELWDNIRDILILVFERNVEPVLEPVTNPIVVQPMHTKSDELYQILKGHLGKHLTLNPNVPKEVGCAEAVSTVLKMVGVQGIPETGFAGTAVLYEWLKTNPHFEQIKGPEVAAVIISPTNYGNGSVEGHTGFVGAFGAMYPGDWGICSNDSQTGLFKELWKLTSWVHYYGDIGQLPVAYFRYLG